MTKTNNEHAKKVYAIRRKIEWAVITVLRGIITPILIVCASHLISDAWTFSILAQDIYSIYSKLTANEPIDLPEHSYANYI